MILLNLRDDERECAQNQEIVNILTSQERVGVFDVEESFHLLLFLGVNFLLWAMTSCHQTGVRLRYQLRRFRKSTSPR